MTDPGAALRELGALVAACARRGDPRLDAEMDPVLDRLGLEYGDGPEAVTAALGAALGIDAAAAAGEETDSGN